jgi:hypothetical protein
MKLGTSRIDATAIAEGVWTTFVIKKLDNTTEEIELRLALSNPEVNTNYRKSMRKSLEQHERILALVSSGKSSKIPDDIAAKINADGRRCFLENIVTDWRGITDPTGKPLVYSVERMEELLAEYPELYAEIEDESRKVERYRVAVLESQAGN